MTSPVIEGDSIYEFTRVPDVREKKFSLIVYKCTDINCVECG